MSRSKETLESVVFGTGLTALTGATTGATIAILKNAPVKQYAISTGLNCGVFGATFFSKLFYMPLREKAINNLQL
ncbi:hypothetical protein BDF21DRAFT_484960 [Thamnidium elegans]|nr:hypothetical protein BDF21DRAFT_484960 [Thamnidium elegans]